MNTDDVTTYTTEDSGATWTAIKVPRLWWHNGWRLAALAFMVNALALTWLLILGLVPNETLAWFVNGFYWVMAFALGATK